MKAWIIIFIYFWHIHFYIIFVSFFLNLYVKSTLGLFENSVSLYHINQICIYFSDSQHTCWHSNLIWYKTCDSIGVFCNSISIFWLSSNILHIFLRFLLCLMIVLNEVAPSNNFASILNSPQVCTFLQIIIKLFIRFLFYNPITFSFCKIASFNLHLKGEIFLLSSEWSGLWPENDLGKIPTFEILFAKFIEIISILENDLCLSEKYILKWVHFSLSKNWPC